MNPSETLQRAIAAEARVHELETFISPFLRKIAAATWDATEDELAVVLIIAERLQMGRTVHGPLNIGTDPRDWKLERRLEFYDAMVYTVIAEIAANRRARDELPTLPEGRVPP